MFDQSVDQEHLPRGAGNSSMRLMASGNIKLFQAPRGIYAGLLTP